MKALKIMIVMLILIMSVGAVCAAENTTEDIVGDDSPDIMESTQKDVVAVDVVKYTANHTVEYYIRF